MAAGVAFLLAGNLAGGIWFAFIGWFLVQAARASYQELQVRQMLRGVQAQDVMADRLLRIPPDLTCKTPWTATSCATTIARSRWTSRGGRSAC